MNPTRVSFTAVPGEFDLTVRVCANRDCECEDVWIELHEVPETISEDDPPVHTFQIDTKSWTEVDPPARSPAMSAVISELLRDYPEYERQLIRQRTTARIASVRRRRTYRIPVADIQTGKMVYYGEMASEKGGYPAGDLNFAFRFHWEGSLFRVVDAYCPNPECGCREGQLRFLELTEEKGPTSRYQILRQFTARISFVGKVTIEEHQGFSAEEAEDICGAFKREKAFLDEMAVRYSQIRGIAERCLEAHYPANNAADFADGSAATRPGRNSPCPCGSGKKFKKCCGR